MVSVSEFVFCNLNFSRRQELEAAAAVEREDLRRRLAGDGNGAAADALRVEAAGFEDACDFKEVRGCTRVLAYYTFAVAEVSECEFPAARCRSPGQS